MGLDASAVCLTLPKGMFFRLSGQKTLQSISKIASDWALTQGLGPLFQAEITPDGVLSVSLIPVADPLLFSVAHERLTVGFRSSGAGPGYHMAAIDLLDHIAARLKIKWQWVGSDGTCLDETGYANTRDAAALRAAMLDFLRGISHVASTMSKKEELSDFNFCLPMGLGHQVGLAACPKGLKSLEWAFGLHEVPDGDLMAAAEWFFPWWEEGLGPSTWQSLLQAQLWQNAEWRPACLPQDHLTIAQIKHSRAKCYPSLPVDLSKACEEYDDHQTSSLPPAPKGIGYRKRLIYEQIFRSWSFSRPGYLWPVDNGEGAAWDCAWFWLGASALSYTIEPSTAQPYEWSADCVGPEVLLRQGHSYRMTKLERSEDGSGVQHAYVVSPREDRVHLLILTLSSQLDWPYEQFEEWVASVSCPDLSTTLPDSPALTH